MKSAAETLEERIRECAYHIWEANGRPSGRDEEFWTQACETIAADGRPDEFEGYNGASRSRHRRPGCRASVAAKQHSQGWRFQPAHSEHVAGATSNRSAHALKQLVTIRTPAAILRCLDWSHTTSEVTVCVGLNDDEGLNGLLRDPLIRLVMQSDGVTEQAMIAVIEQLRRSLAARVASARIDYSTPRVPLSIDGCGSREVATSGGAGA